MKPDSDEGIEVARAILHYLHGHPDAKDTLEGIAQWWLTGEDTGRKLKEVEKGLSILLNEGLVVEIRRGGLLPYYRLNRPEEKAVNNSLSNSDRGH